MNAAKVVTPSQFDQGVPHTERVCLTLEIGQNNEPTWQRKRQLEHEGFRLVGRPVGTGLDNKIYLSFERTHTV